MGTMKVLVEHCLQSSLLRHASGADNHQVDLEAIGWLSSLSMGLLDGQVSAFCHCRKNWLVGKRSDGNLQDVNLTIVLADMDEINLGSFRKRGFEFDGCWKAFHI